MYLFGYIRYIRPHIDYEETVLVGAGAVFILLIQRKSTDTDPDNNPVLSGRGQ